MSVAPDGPLASPSRAGFSVVPAMVILAVLWLLTGATYLMETGFVPFMIRVMVAPLLGGVVTLTWWLGFTGLGWRDKVLVAVFFLAALGLLTVPHGGNGMFYLFASLPVAVSAWLGWLALTPWLSWPPRRIGLLIAIGLGVGFFSLVRIQGIDGDFAPEYEWAWKPTSESRHLAEVDQVGAAIGQGPDRPANMKAGPGDWPAFRGPERDSIVQDTTIGTDWKTNPPKVLWQHLIGPGWSSFSVVGKLLFTQEQRAENELIVCYETENGKELWNHAVPTRFSEPVAGPGPRATPTYFDGKIYAQGANGHLVCLDAYTGKPLWAKDLRTDTGAEPPQWGFSGSPLVHKGLVSVFAGAENKTLAAYQADTGEQAWISSRKTRAELSYCSTHLFTIHGVEQLIILTDRGAVAYEPVTGKQIWEHDWETNGVARCIQPALVDGSDIIIGTGLGVGAQRIHVALTDGQWAVSEVWKTGRFKSYYNDMVIHEGHAYGYDANMFVCVDLKTGEIGWKARGYGSGQTLLLARQGLLVVLTEKGEVALVEANPKAHKELARLKVLEGKTWNHPVIAHGKLFVRNGAEIACLELPKAGAGLAKE